MGTVTPPTWTPQQSTRAWVCRSAASRYSDWAIRRPSVVTVRSVVLVTAAFAPTASASFAPSAKPRVDSVRVTGIGSMAVLSAVSRSNRVVMVPVLTWVRNPSPPGTSGDWASDRGDPEAHDRRGDQQEQPNREGQPGQSAAPRPSQGQRHAPVTSSRTLPSNTASERQ